MNTIPVPLQNVLRQRYQSSLLLEKRDEGIEKQYKKIEYLPEPPEQEYEGPPEGFGNQVTNRLKEIGSDPYTYAWLTGGILAGALFPPSIPALVALGAGSGAISATQQAAEGDYGAAAVDVGLGFLPFGSKGVRGTFGPKGSMVPQAGRIRTSATEPTIRTKREIDVLADLRKDLESSRGKPVKVKTQIPYYGHNFERYPYSPKPKYQMEFEPSDWAASQGMSELPPRSPWQNVETDMWLRDPARPGMPGTRVRSDVPGGSELVSPYGLSPKEIARIEKFGNAAEKSAIQKAKQEKLGKLIGGRVGDQVAASESPFMKSVIDDYYKAFGTEPSQAAAREWMSTRGISDTSAYDPSVPLKSKPIEKSVVPTIISPKQPYEYSDKKEYLEAIENQIDRKLTDVEIDNLGKVYDESVASNLETNINRNLGSPSDAQMFPRLSRYTGEYIEPSAEPVRPSQPGPIRRAAAALALTGELTGSAPRISEPFSATPPSAVDLVPGKITEPFSRPTSVEATIPSVPSGTPKSTPSSKPSVTTTSTPATTVVPKISVSDILKDETPKEQEKPTSDQSEVETNADRENYLEKYIDKAPAIIPAAIMARAMANTSTDAGIIGQKPTVPGDRGPQRFKILPSSGGGRRYNQGRDTDDLVAMIAPSAEELRTALKRGQLGAVSGYYQLA